MMIFRKPPTLGPARGEQPRQGPVGTTDGNNVPSSGPVFFVEEPPPEPEEPEPPTP